MNPEDRIDPQKLEVIQYQMKNVELSSTSSLTIAESLSDSCSLSKCTEVDAKFLKRIYQGKVEKKNLCSISEFLKEIHHKKKKNYCFPDS